MFLYFSTFISLFLQLPPDFWQREPLAPCIRSRVLTVLRVLHLRLTQYIIAAWHTSSSLCAQSLVLQYTFVTSSPPFSPQYKSPATSARLFVYIHQYNHYTTDFSFLLPKQNFFILCQALTHLTRPTSYLPIQDSFSVCWRITLSMSSYLDVRIFLLC